MKFTVATPTYNRGAVLDRVYDSLKTQTYKGFEWIIIDDGSTDHTAVIVEQWKMEADFPIRYLYQENNGKHMALNTAVQLAEGELFLIADSDDSFKPESLEVLLKYWEDIPEDHRKEFRGVTCRCYNPETQETIGKPFPNGVHDVLGIDSFFKWHYDFEMWGFNRTDVMKEFPFPDTRAQGLAYCPETIVWHKMGMKYKVRFVNDALRAYYLDQDNSTSRKKNRSKENILLWMHYVNDLGKYFRYAPMKFIKAYVGLMMDGLLLGYTVRDIIQMANSVYAKTMVILFSPVGFVMFLRRKKYRDASW